MTYTSEFPIISVTVDAVVFRVSHVGPVQAEVLVIRRKNDPYKGFTALPGGFLNPDETAEQAALRELEEETGVSGARRIVALSTRSHPGRDPRGPVVSLPYAMSVPWATYPKAGDDASEAFWMPIDVAKKVTWAFDHKKIFDEAVSKHLRDLLIDAIF
jgi:8-oxo-dGTP diphosphatase